MTRLLTQPMLLLRSYVGADYSFRRRDFNRLFCKSTVFVKYKI